MNKKRTPPYPLIRITDMALEDRPREKGIRNGIHSLSNTELLAILIGNGNYKQSALDLARQVLLKSQNDLYYLGKIRQNDLLSIPGIGSAKAIRILAALELARRRMSTPAPEKVHIRSSKDAFQAIRPELNELSHEEFWVILLSRSNRMMDKIKISQGGISGTITDIRLILQEALAHLASAIILTHNHPSGNLTPSHADLEITSKIKKAAKLMDISVLDHLIIGEENYFSFADENQL